MEILSFSVTAYANPYVSRSIKDFKLNFYNGGYKAVITNKRYGGSYNDVTVSQVNTGLAMLTERGAACKTFKSPSIFVDKDNDFYAPFTVQLYAEDMSLNAITTYNNGKIKIDV